MKKHTLLGGLVIFVITLVSCVGNTDTQPDSFSLKIKNETDFLITLNQHLNAVSTKDIGALKSTLSPKGEMQLILSDDEILNSVDSFVENQAAWFQDTTWTFETRVINTKIGDRVGLAVVETIYREPIRNGLPYFNRMTISYGLEKIEGKWYVILDHASSVEKSTDKK